MHGERWSGGESERERDRQIQMDKKGEKCILGSILSSKWAINNPWSNLEPDRNRQREHIKMEP